MLNSCNNKNIDTNPFFKPFDTPNGVPPFDKIKNEHYVPAFEEGMKLHNAEVDAIVNNAEAPTFENTIVALDNSGEMLTRVSSVFFALRISNTTDRIDSIAEIITPRRTRHYDNINLNKKLFARIKAVYEDSTRTDLTTEQKTLIDKYYKRYVRAGIMLSKEKQDRLKEINKELGMLNLKFGQNLLAETKNYELVIVRKEDLSGLPADIIALAAHTAKTRGKEGKWVFTLSKPSWEPFLQYADNRALREKLYKAMYNRCNNNNEFDNKDIIVQIIALRLERANLLGYKSHADYVLEETMAKTPEAAMKLLNSIWKHALPQAKAELAELQAMAKKDGSNFKLESWDWWYYTEKVRKAKYALDDEVLKPYFKTESVRDGVFAVAKKLYGLKFKERKDIPTYQMDVQAFEVLDADDSFIGTIYMDFYTRDGLKHNGAWMGRFRKQQISADEQPIAPVVYNVENFPEPTDGKPSLLTIDQVQTLFHEFGHGLQGLLSKCNYFSLSGTAVPRDFVELPSQIMEHWATEPEVMKKYAKHYETGEVIPDTLIEKIGKAAKFNQGFRTTELVAAAILDMKWHTVTENANKNFLRPEGSMKIDVDKFEKTAMSEIGLIPEIIPRYKSTYFAHIFDGGYSAGYYSYLWSEVLDSDAYQAFVDTGNIFDQETAKSFRENVLSRGGSEDPMALYKKFRGTEPNPIYLLKNRGFVE